MPHNGCSTSSLNSGQLRAYVHWHLSSDTWGRNLYRPAPYLTHQNAKYQLEMLRIQTESWIDYIPALPTWSSRPDTLPRQAVPTVYLSRIHTWRRQAHNQPMPSVTGRAQPPQVLQQIPVLTRLIDTQPFQLLDSEEQIWMALGKPPPFPNTQRFPNLETGSHSYVRRVCPRLENAPKTIATNNSIIFFGRQLITGI